MMLNGNSYPWLSCHRLVAVLECHLRGSTSERKCASPNPDSEKRSAEYKCHKHYYSILS